MSRILGILCGATLAILALAWLLGPIAGPPAASGPGPVVPSAVAADPLEAPGPRANDGIAEAVVSAESTTAAADSAPAVEDAAADLSAAVTAIDPVDAIFMPATAADAAVDTDDVADPDGTAAPVAEQWFAFWSPFRTEIAARGFIAELQRTTGLDYRVVRQDTAVFEVAVAFSDAAELESRLRAIEQATGLVLPDG